MRRCRRCCCAAAVLLVVAAAAVMVGEERCSWGRYCDRGGEAGRRKVGADSRERESDGVRGKEKLEVECPLRLMSPRLV